MFGVFGPLSSPSCSERRLLGSFLASRLRLGRFLGASWRLLTRLGRVLGRLGRILERLGDLLGRLERVLERLGRLLERLGGVLEASWGVLGLSGRHLGPWVFPNWIQRRYFQGQNRSPPSWNLPPRGTRNLRLELEDCMPEV